MIAVGVLTGLGLWLLGISAAASLGVLQLAVAAAMVLGNLPPVLRSLHQATGVAVWIAAFTLAYLARQASDDPATGTHEVQSAHRAPRSPHRALVTRAEP